MSSEDEVANRENGWCKGCQPELCQGCGEGWGWNKERDEYRRVLLNVRAWWLTEGKRPFLGAPACIFQVQEALEPAYRRQPAPNSCLPAEEPAPLQRIAQLEKELEELRTSHQETRLKYAGAIGLLCQITQEPKALEDDATFDGAITDAVLDWCKATGWTMKTFHGQISVEPRTEELPL